MSNNEEKKLNESLDEAIKERATDYTKIITLAIVGKVSSGKSSLLNAFFKRNRDEKLAEVGATSGVTKDIKIYELEKNIKIIDSPGLGDVMKENSEATKKFMENIDVGILVVIDSADETQRKTYEDLKKHCVKVFVVLNKIDMYDKKKSAIPEVVQQWKTALGMKNEEKIYLTSTDGYDPNYDNDCEMDIRGIDELREDVLKFMEKDGKRLLLERQLERNSTLARRAIYTALLAVAGEAFIPGSAVYITATQATAIMAIHYIYTGEVLSKSSAIATIPLFAGQSVGSNLFLWIKSVIPPTGIADVAAAGIAMSVTLAMLSAVNWVYENGHNLDDKTELKEQFNKFYDILNKTGVAEIWDIIKTQDRGKIMALIAKFVP